MMIITMIMIWVLLQVRKKREQKIKQTIDFCRMLTGQILTCPLDINIHKNRKLKLKLTIDEC